MCRVALAGAVNIQIDQLAASEDLTDEQKLTLTELKEGFNEVVNASAESFQNAEGLTGNTLTQGLQEAFSSLMDKLNDLLAAIFIVAVSLEWNATKPSIRAVPPTSFGPILP